MANYKAIVIDVKAKSTPNGMEQEWTDVTTHMPILTRDIKTPALDSKSDLTSVVSGMPTIFARANLFKLAIDYVDAPDKERDDSDGLLNYYTGLVEEWRGFIACIALDYTRINVRRIRLAYSDGKTFADTKNVYEPKGAFGNVLFERRKLWTEQGSDVSGDTAPFIDVITYEGKVIGAISPESLLFTSPSYRIDADHPFINKNTKKLTDPLKNSLSQDEALTLLAYVEYIEDKINELGRYYGDLSDDIRPNYSTIQSNIRKWKEEIRRYCEKRNYDQDAKSVPPVQNFKSPYSLVFNYSSNLYGLEGIIYDDETQAPENKIFFDPKNILLPKSSEIARIDFSNNEIVKNPALLEEQPVYVLKAQIKGKDNEYAFFALPITPLGLNVFGKNIGALTGIDPNNAISSKLTAEFDPSRPTDNLDVVLEITTQSKKRRELKESYTVKSDRVSNKDIMLWPNFISTQWNRYFLYSEMPHNTVSRRCPFCATPIVGTYQGNDFRILVDEESKEKEPVLLSSNGKICVTDKVKRDTGLEARLHVVADNRVADNDYKYEIYECNLPFKGVKLSSGNRDSGYLVIRYTTASGKPNLPQNELGIPRDLRPATVGVDFGSTNTSVAYSVDGNLKGIHFDNHRVSLLQAGRKAACKERDLFFFQSKEIEGNAIKSILTLNDQRRLIETDHSAQAKEVSGGMPCFDPSLLPVENVAENRIVLKCNEIGNVHLVYNMKWTTQDGDIANKKAYLRSLMLHVYAQLFVENCVPETLKWSYPSAMGAMLVNQYSQIWNDLQVGLSPVNNHNLIVCRADVAGQINVDEGGWNIETESVNNGWGNNPSLGGETGWDTSQQAQSLSGWGNSNQNEEWGDSSNNAPGWGTSVSNSGWEQPAPQKTVVEDLTPDNDEVNFDFKEIEPNKCMTEAAAVANFNGTRTNFKKDRRTLTLCFDVGGSTTDISAIIYTSDGVKLVKQNSIKFAAQQVSKAASYEPNLKKVLLEMCQQYDIRIPGLNLGPDRFNNETAAFYFEQLLDRIPTTGLPSLYQSLNANCHNFMAVNLYVTGLIVFYAGQLTHKLVNVIRKSLAKEEPAYASFIPMVNVMFAGKGARIFEWFGTIQHTAANSYYQQMFIKGYGGMDEARTTLAGPPQIQLAEEVSNSVKYEVSKGLALPPSESIKAPADDMGAIEILGEDNFEIIKASTGETVTLNFDNAITPKMMEHINIYLVEKVITPFTCKRFSDFSLLFFNATSHLFGLKLTQGDFIDGFRNMNILSYISNQPEYRRAKANKQGFDYVAPVIILEGMKFYEEVLLKKLK